jgi:hypothetical protein
MRAFLAGVAAAVLVAVVAVYALNSFQRPADSAYASSASVRL